MSRLGWLTCSLKLRLEPDQTITPRSTDDKARLLGVIGSIQVQNASAIGGLGRKASTRRLVFDRIRVLLRLGRGFRSFTETLRQVTDTRRIVRAPVLSVGLVGGTSLAAIYSRRRGLLGRRPHLT